jgi:hypothetical protein
MGGQVKTVRRIWVWAAWAVGAALAGVAAFFMLQSNRSARKAAAAGNKEERARVRLADVEAEKKVVGAKRNGSFAGRLRRDGAGR